MVDLDEQPIKIYPKLPRDQPNPSAPIYGVNESFG